jgi:hypothetical protein
MYCSHKIITHIRRIEINTSISISLRMSIVLIVQIVISVMRGATERLWSCAGGMVVVVVVGNALSQLQTDTMVSVYWDPYE